MMPEAAASQRPELCAKVAFGNSEGLCHLMKAERLIQPWLDVAVDPGQNIRRRVRANHAGDLGDGGAETSQQKPEMV